MTPDSLAIFIEAGWLSTHKNLWTSAVEVTEEIPTAVISEPIANVLHFLFCVSKKKL